MAPSPYMYIRICYPWKPRRWL